MIVTCIKFRYGLTNVGTLESVITVHRKRDYLMEIKKGRGRIFIDLVVYVPVYVRCV